MPPLQFCCWPVASAFLLRVCVPPTFLNPEAPQTPPQIKLALGCGSGWVLEPRAFLDLSPRCSSEELLDRLFKKSVVTEAEVTTGLHAPPAQTTCPSKYSPHSHSVPQLRDLLGSPGPHRVSQHPSQLSKLPQTQALTIPPSPHLASGPALICS